MPGLREFMAKYPNMFNPNKIKSNNWLKGLCKEDLELLCNLGKLHPTQISMKIKELHNMAVELNVEEDREMSRGKVLGVLKN